MLNEREFTDAFPMPDIDEAGRRCALGSQPTPTKRSCSTSRTARSTSPFGPLLVAATRAGLARVAFEREDHDAVLDAAGGRRSARESCVSAPRTRRDRARQLDEYFAGRRRHFDLTVDLQLAHGFRRDVLAHLRDIEYGGPRATPRLRAAAGTAGGGPGRRRARAAHNPVPVVVPCHRVVRSDGTIGQYLGGPEMKAALLAMEAA